MPFYDKSIKREGDGSMYRSELKYVIDNNTALIIKNRINKFLEYDKNSDENGYYNVSSLYFYDYKNTALNDNLNSQKIRKKYRIRIYNQQGDFIRLEKKIKHDQVGYKKSCLITRAQYESILRNDYMALMNEENDELLQEFLHYATMVNLKPKVIVVYISLKEECYTIDVMNTGQPILEDAMQFIWDGLYNADEARIFNNHSFGLGLSIVKGIQQIMNQNYGCENREGWVVFWFDVKKIVNN